MADYDFSNVDLSQFGAIGGDSQGEAQPQQPQQSQGDENYNFDNVDVSQFGAVHENDIKGGSIAESKRHVDIEKLKKEHPWVYESFKRIAGSPAASSALSTTTKVLGKADPVTNQIIGAAQNLRLPELGGGILQSAQDITKSVGDIPFQLTGSKYRLPGDYFAQGARKDPVSKLAFELSREASKVAPIGKTAQALEGAARYYSPEALRLARGTTGTLGRYALAGAALQGEGPGGRLGGAAEGALLGAGEGITSEGAVKKLLQEKKFQEAVHNTAYNQISDQAKNIDYMPVKDKLNTDLLKNLRGRKSYLKRYDDKGKLKGAIDTYIEKPSYETAHRLQSDLGKVLSAAQRAKDKTSVEIDAYNHAAQFRDKLKNSIYSSFSNSGREDLAQKYANVTESYKNNVVPYQLSALEAAAKPKGQYGRISAKSAMKQITKDPYAMEALAHRHPKIMSSALSKAALTGLGMGAGYGLHNVADIFGLGGFTREFSSGGQ